MSDESSEDKTHEATPKRRREAAQKGQSPKSQEVTTAFLLLASAGVLTVLSGGAVRAIVETFRMSVGSLPVLPSDPIAAAAYLQALALRTFQGLAPLLLALGAVALAVAGAQGRGVVTTEPLTLKWNRLDPIAKAKQLWGWKAVAELVKSFLKLAIVGLAVYAALGSITSDLGLLGQTTPFALLGSMQRYTVRILLGAGGAYLALALADYGFQVWQHEKRLRMSREEIKRETKETEGDQVVKVRRRTMARQLTRRRMLAAVAEADVVVTNPTHIAVALKYDPATAHAPIVVAMGERKVAERIKKLAYDAGVPTVENKPLARALFATSEVGRSIPFELFVAVAELLAFVYRARGAGLPGYRARA
jgi:flagellar biosynthetic protein FlhB